MKSWCSKFPRLKINNHKYMNETCASENAKLNHGVMAILENNDDEHDSLKEPVSGVYDGGKVVVLCFKPYEQ